MKCPKCGFEIDEKYNICLRCGESVSDIRRDATDNDNTISDSKEKLETKSNYITQINNEKEAENKELNYLEVSSQTEKIEEQNEMGEERQVQNNSQNNIIICPKCGSRLQEKWNYCPNCHTKYNDNTNFNEEEHTSSLKENKTIWIICICLLSPILTRVLMLIFSFFAYYLGETLTTIIFLFLTYLPYICYIKALELIVKGKVKFPHNKKFKNLYKVFIALIILFVLLGIFGFIIMIKILETIFSMG